MTDKRKIKYLRLSLEDLAVTRGSAVESSSIIGQRECIDQYLIENGMDPDSFEEIVDDGFSGTDMKRPGMKRLLAMVEADTVEMIIVRDLSRFARNHLEAGYCMEMLFPDHGVRFVSINDGYDSAGDRSADLELNIAFTNVLNQLYSRDLSRKVKSAIDIKKRNAEYIASTPPFGYKKGEQKYTLVPDPETAPIVRNIFEWFDGGMNPTEIARKLNDEGVPTPSAYAKRKSLVGLYWNSTTSENILRNRTYRGDTVLNKTRRESPSSKRRSKTPPERWEIVENTHEGIVPSDLFDRVQCRCQSGRRSAGLPQRRREPADPLQSLVYCDVCGHTMAKQKNCWKCNTARIATGTGCERVISDCRLLEDYVLREINARYGESAAEGKGPEKNRSAERTEADRLQAEIRAMRAELDGEPQKRAILYEELVEGRLTKEQYIAKKNSVKEKTDQLKFQIALNEECLALLKEKEAAANAGHSGEKTDQSNMAFPALTQEIAKRFIKRITVAADKSIHIEWNADEWE